MWRTNMSDARKPTVPSMRKKAQQTTLMYPKKTAARSFTASITVIHAATVF
jgi:hypothetical protein